MNPFLTSLTPPLLYSSLTTLTTHSIIIIMLFGGFYINVTSLWIGFAPIEYMSFIKYAYAALVVNEFTGWDSVLIPPASFTPLMVLRADPST